MRDERKERLHRDGIPVGVGIPEERPPTLEELQEMREARDQDKMVEQQSLLQAMEENQYGHGMSRTDRGEFLDKTTHIKPFEYKYLFDKEGRLVNAQIVGGHVPMDLLTDYSGFTCPTISQTNLDEHEIRLMYRNFKISAMSVRMSKPRDEYTPQTNALVDNTENLVIAKVAQSRDGMIVRESGTSREERTIGLRRKKSWKDNVMDRVRGRGE